MTEELVYKEIFKKPSNKTQKSNHYDISVVNEMHQIDILYLPKDAGYKYALCVVDCASRFKAAQPLKTKYKAEILQQLDEIYKTMKKPQKLNGDGEMKQLKGWCNDNSIQLIINEPKHHCSFVENMNKELAKLIFKRQHLKELETKKPNTEWVETLQQDIDTLNNRVTSMIKMKPRIAYKRQIVEQPVQKLEEGEDQLRWKVGTRVRRLFNKDEILTLVTNKLGKEAGVDKTRRRATDPYWSQDIYLVTEIFESPLKYTMHAISLVNKDGKELAKPVPYPHHYNYYQLQPTQF